MVQDKDLGKYKHNGIFINEIDQSIITLPVQDVLIKLVPGFSKKGPVNRPVYITNKPDFINIFGDIDRQLERKGSFFHRTCLKMIESGPIWALNLLSTLESRDRVNWESISVGSYYDNDIIRTMPYSRLFNRQDFWYRDDESFLDYVNIDGEVTDQLLHLTNLGDKTITTFIFKSAINGFDMSAEDWYGGVSKVPAYLNSKDWISDYMVTVLIVQGDWTNYSALAVDTTYSTYFTSAGLIKSKVTDFANLQNVTVLANYDVSLIPYFRDLNNRVMYIKSIINNDTDKTGLFAAYNEDYILSSDYPTGKMDMIGDGMVDENKDYIDFVSYQETISENLTYTQKLLDSTNNVFGNYSTALTDKYPSTTLRTAAWTNGYIDQAYVSSVKSTFAEIVNFINDYVYIQYNQPSTSLVANDAVFFNIDKNPISANTAYYIIGTILSNSAYTYFQISEFLGGAKISLPSITSGAKDLYLQRAGISLSNLSTYFVIDGNRYTFDTGATITFDPLEITYPNIAGYHNRYDVLYLSKGNLAQVNILKGVQSDNAAASLPKFTLSLTDNIILGYSKLYYSGTTYSGLTNTYYPVSLTTSATGGYKLYTDISITSATTNAIKYFDMTFVGTSGGTDYTNYSQLRYRNAFDELSTKLSEGKALLINSKTGSKLPIPTVTTYDYSTTSDGKLRIRIDSENYLNYTGGTSSFLIHYLDDEFVINSTLTTNRIYTTNNDITLLGTSGQTTTTAAGVIGQYSALYQDYYNGVINNWDFIYFQNLTGSTTNKIYMKMWFEGEMLYIDLMDADKISPSPYLVNWSTVYGQSAICHSLESNYKQTIEIESFDVTKYPTLVTEISVDKTRFSELVTGGFLEAYYDTTAYAIGGDKYGQDPRKLTRILSVRLDSTNSNWKVIRCDSPIKIAAYNSIGTIGGIDYQTMYYPEIDIYVDTYKGIKLDPFVISTDSVPNGTEARQSSILDIMANTTNLGKGLTNKNKISWRYLVDAFGLGLTNASKQQYADIGKDKLNCISFVNMPSARMFKKSTNPYFINDDGTLNSALVKVGGDETKSPSFLYTFATGVGRSTMGYFFPYVTIDDDGIPKDVPPSSFIATTYMNKHNTSQGGVYPWTIAAGITDGRITGIADTEMDFTDDDLDNFAAMGANLITKKGTAGFCIESEYTAQVFPYSSLSLLHSREVLIELENRMYDMLLGYQWRFNTPEIQSEIKFRADKICQTLKNSQALYSYKNVMDQTNNTNYIVDLQMGVIDTYIEIIKGMGVIVNNITILKKGDLESGGFA